MPQRMTVVSLSDQEREALKHAINGKSVESVIAEVKRDVLGTPRTDEDNGRKHAPNPVQTLANTQSVNGDRLRAGQEFLARRGEKLRALPQTTAGNELLEHIEEASRIIDESLEMIGDR